MSEHVEIEPVEGDTEQAGSGPAVNAVTGQVTAAGAPLPEIPAEQGDAELPGHEVEMIGDSRGFHHGDRVTVDLATAQRLVRDGHARPVGEGDE